MSIGVDTSAFNTESFLLLEFYSGTTGQPGRFSEGDVEGGPNPGHSPPQDTGFEPGIPKGQEGKRGKTPGNLC